MTCADALEEAVMHYDGIVSSHQILDYIKQKYPDDWKDSTIRGHIIGCSVNHSSSHHHRYFRKFLFTVGPGQVRLYDPETDGKWVWASTGMVKIESGGTLAHSIRIFLSYSSKDKKLSGELKEELESRGFEVFLAHEDIEPSKEWEEEIIRNLKECKIFIPIVSNNFKESEWTDQESGIAFVGDKLIIPLNIGLVPYGFIGRYQALKYDGNISHTCVQIIEIIMKSSVELMRR